MNNLFYVPYYFENAILPFFFQNTAIPGYGEGSVSRFPINKISKINTVCQGTLLFPCTFYLSSSLAVLSPK
jgi:hypothetical protein